MQAINLKIFVTSLFIWAVTTVAAQSISARSIEIVVHRGANALAPENTIASTDSALKYGALLIRVSFGLAMRRCYVSSSVSPRR